MSGTPPRVQTERVDENMERVHISFTVPARNVDYDQLPVGVPQPMVPVATVGSTSPIQLTVLLLPGLAPLSLPPITSALMFLSVLHSHLPVL
jgi:hypothetical protein